MATTRQPLDSADRAQTFLDWTRINSRALTIGAAVIVIAAGAWWFTMQARQKRAINAGKALMQAQQSLNAGNAALATSDLQKVATNYSSTNAGAQAAELLAQLDYDNGKFQDGIDVLTRARHDAASYQLPAILGLIGDGYMQMGKAADAARQYDASADASAMKLEKAAARAKAARAYAVAGDTAKARHIWSALVDDPDAQSVSAEARIRLGELTARVATK